jgi:hypothetical protein
MAQTRVSFEQGARSFLAVTVGVTFRKLTMQTVTLSTHLIRIIVMTNDVFSFAQAAAIGLTFAAPHDDNRCLLLLKPEHILTYLCVSAT